MLKIHKHKTHLNIPMIWLLMTLALALVVYSINILTSFPTHAASSTTKTLSDISTMQEMTQTICAKSKVGDTNTLTDTRDNNTYTIRKHEDNNCWMTQNLRLVAPEGGKVLTPKDSDIEEEHVMPQTLTSLQPGDFTYEHTDREESYYKEDTLSTFGAYYSFNTATAGHGSIDMLVADKTITTSICPKGWKLPSSANNTSYANLMEVSGILSNQGGVNKVLTTPYNFMLSGSAYAGVLYEQSESGLYFTNTIYDNPDIYALYLSREFGIVHPTATQYMAGFVGRSIRCVALGGIAADSNLSVEVYPTLMIDAVSNMHQIVDSSVVNTGTISTTITANTNYQVLLSSNDSTMRNPKLDSTDDRTIPTISATTPTILTSGTSAWGIATGSPDGTNGNSTYVGITTTPQSYYNTTSLGAYPSQTIHTYGIGVTISPLLPSGIYSTSITVTAVGV